MRFNDGQTQKTITVRVKGDVAQETHEQFTVALSNPTNGAQIGTATANGTILNDDQPVAAPILSIAAANAVLNEGQTGTTDFTFTVTRANGTGDGEVTWTIGTGNGITAEDFEDLDRHRELHRQRDLEDHHRQGEGRRGHRRPTNSSPSPSAMPTGGAQIGTATASGTILNDDQPVAAPILSIGTATAVAAH